MAYIRQPYYIYTNGEELYLDGKRVEEDVINVFLYMLNQRPEEFQDRLKKGEEILSRPDYIQEIMDKYEY